jgi:hypothetical protein
MERQNAKPAIHRHRDAYGTRRTPHAIKEKPSPLEYHRLEQMEQVRRSYRLVGGFQE